MSRGGVSQVCLEGFLSETGGDVRKKWRKGDD